MKCQMISCLLKAQPNQKYCSKEHAPYGNYGLDDDLRSERTQKSSTPVVLEQSPASSLCDDSASVDGLKTSLTPLNNNAQESKREPILSKTKFELKKLNAEGIESYPKPSEKKSPGYGWQEKRKVKRKLMLEIDNHTPKTERAESKISLTEGAIEKDFSSELKNPLSSLTEARFHSMSLIDESIIQLRDMMKSLPKGTPRVHPIESIQAACNCAKQISTLIRLKLDIAKEILKK